MHTQATYSEFDSVFSLRGRPADAGTRPWATSLSSRTITPADFIRILPKALLYEEIFTLPVDDFIKQMRFCREQERVIEMYRYKTTAFKTPREYFMAKFTLRNHSPCYLRIAQTSAQPPDNPSVATPIFPTVHTVSSLRYTVYSTNMLSLF